jgi:hypothetical protein
MAENDGVKIATLTHDFVAKKSFVGLVWESDASKSLGLQVPFCCSPEQLPAEAEKAVRRLSHELASMPITVVP